MTKLVKTDSAVESASREFSARLTKMLGVPEVSSVPAVVRPLPTGQRVLFSVGEHVATLFRVRTEIGRNQKRFIVFDFEVTESTTMPVLGIVEYAIDVDTRSGPSIAKSFLEAVGLVNTFLERSGDGIITCNKRVAVTCTERLTTTGFKIMIPTIRAIDA